MSSVPTSLQFISQSPGSRVSSPTSSSSSSSSSSNTVFIADLRREERQRKEAYQKFKKKFNSMQTSQLLEAEEGEEEEEREENYTKSSSILSSSFESKNITNKRQSSSASSSKKIKMRTAQDVCNRIRWDSGLKEKIGSFAMGYLDRFIGLVDTPFAEFGWEDVPLHRIQYFRYKQRIVWDKRKKLDHFFGSTAPSGMQQHVTIDRVILEEDEEEEEEEEEEENEVEEEEEGGEVSRDNSCVSLEFELELEEGGPSSPSPATSFLSKEKRKRATSPPTSTPSPVVSPIIHGPLYPSTSPSPSLFPSSGGRDGRRRSKAELESRSGGGGRRGMDKEEIRLSRSLPSKLRLEPALDLALDPEFKLISDSFDRDLKEKNRGKRRGGRGNKNDWSSSSSRGGRGKGKGRGREGKSYTPLGPAPTFIKGKKNLFEKEDSDEEEEKEKGNEKQKEGIYQEEVGFFETEEEEEEKTTATKARKEGKGGKGEEGRRVRSVSFTEETERQVSIEPSTSAPTRLPVSLPRMPGVILKQTTKVHMNITEEEWEGEDEYSITPPVSMMNSRAQWQEMKREMKAVRKEEKMKKTQQEEEAAQTPEVQRGPRVIQPALDPKKAKKEAKRLALEQKKKAQQAKKLFRGNTTTRPNHFISIRAHHPSIVSFIQAAQARIMDRYPYFEEAMIDPSSLHLTLNVMRLAGQQDIQKAKKAMELFRVFDLPSILPEQSWPFPLPGWWPSSPVKGGQVVRQTFGIDSSSSSGAEDVIDLLGMVEMGEGLLEEESSFLLSVPEVEEAGGEWEKKAREEEATVKRSQKGAEVEEDEEEEEDFQRTQTTERVPTSPPRFVLPLSGLGKFPRGEVLFAHINEGPELIKLHEIFHALKYRFQEVGLGTALSDGARPFQPHLTVFKLSKVSNPKRKKRLKMVSQGAFSEAASFSRECARTKRLCSHKVNTEEAPWQPVEALELSCMLEKGPDRYYKCLHRVHL